MYIFYSKNYGIKKKFKYSKYDYIIILTTKKDYEMKN